MKNRKILQSGMIFDCARRYYSVNTIRGLVDALSGHEGAFLQLHLTDNENVGIECVNIAHLDRNIQVTYWSWDGDAQDSKVEAERRAERASVSELQAEGFDILICNSYYLYFVPSARNFNAYDNDDRIRNLSNNWSLRSWNSNKGELLSDIGHIIGSAVSMWSEESAQFSEEEIIAFFIRQYNAMDWVNHVRILPSP